MYFSRGLNKQILALNWAGGFDFFFFFFLGGGVFKDPAL